MDRLLFIAAMLYVSPALSQVAGNRTAAPSAKVQEMKVYSVTAKQAGDKSRDDSVLIEYWLYDKNRNVLENSTYGSDGNLKNKVKYKYNAAGKMTDKTEFDGQGEVHERMTYKYNDMDSITEEAKYERGNEMEYKSTYKYNKAGKKIMKADWREEGGLVKKIVYGYDGRGNQTEEKTYDRYDSLNIHYEYKYNMNNNLIEETRYDGKRQEWKFVYSYNDQNKKEKETRIYPYETSNSTTAFSYDKDQHLIEEIIYDYKNRVMQKSSFTFVNGRLKTEEANNTVTEFEYDSTGIKTTEKAYSGKQLLFEKIFDSQGNVIYWSHYAGSSLSFGEIYLYDNETHLKLMKQSKFDGANALIEESEFKYDDKGNKVEEVNKDANHHILSKKVWIFKYF